MIKKGDTSVTTQLTCNSGALYKSLGMYIANKVDLLAAIFW